MTARYRISTLVAAGLMVVLAGACSGFKETFGLAKSAPDESQVRLNAPLIIPPDYNLRPPRPEGQSDIITVEVPQRSMRQIPTTQPGEKAPNQTRTVTVERVPLPEPTSAPGLTIRGGTGGHLETVAPQLSRQATSSAPQPSGPRTVTQGELAFLRQAGAIAPPVNVRQVIEQEAKVYRAHAEAFAEMVLFGARSTPTELDTGSGETTDAVVEPRAVSEMEKATIRRRKSGFLF